MASHTSSHAATATTAAVSATASVSSFASQPSFVASPAVFQAYVALLLVGGQILLPILVVTFLLSRRVMRHAVLTNFLITWCFFSFGGCFLFYAGSAQGPQPSPAVCLTQVSFTYGAPILTATGGLCLVIKFLYDFRTRKFAPVTEQRFFTSLLVAPYVMGLIYGLLALSNGVAHPEGLTRTFLLCELSSAADTFALPTTIILVIVLVTLIILELMIGWKILQFRRHSKVRTGDGRMVTGVPMSFYIRMGLFTFFSFLALPTAFTWKTNTANAVSYVLQATIPLITFLIFGTQLDVLRVWAFWIHDGRNTNSAFGRKGSGGESGSTDEKSHTVSVANSEMTMVASSDEHGEKGFQKKALGTYEPSLRTIEDAHPPPIWPPVYPQNSVHAHSQSLSLSQPPSRSGSPAPGASARQGTTTPPQAHTRSQSFTLAPAPSSHGFSRSNSPARQGLAQGHVRTLTPTQPYNTNKPLPVHTSDMA